MAPSATTPTSPSSGHFTSGLTTRFAPSPTGLLHLGSAHAALVAWRRAREAGGRFLLRREDIDQGRCRPEFAQAIEADLRWLGLDWDGAVRIQSEHFGEYRAALDRLDAMGLLYRCFCTRADIAASASAPHGPDGPIYPGTCRHLALGAREGERHALRLDVVEAMRRVGPLTWFEEGEGRLPCDPAVFGDPVLARKEAPASYHLCVTHDDALQGVTLVTRGDDLRPATSLHRLLQALLEWPEPSLRASSAAVERSRKAIGQARRRTHSACPARAGLHPSANPGAGG